MDGKEKGVGRRQLIPPSQASSLLPSLLPKYSQEGERLA